MREVVWERTEVCCRDDLLVVPHQNGVSGTQESTGWIGNLFSQVHRRHFEEVVQHTDAFPAYGPGTRS